MGRAGGPGGAALHSDVGVDRGIGELWVISMSGVAVCWLVWVALVGGVAGCSVVRWWVGVWVVGLLCWGG